MSNKLKLILTGLFIVQLGVLAWSYFGKKQQEEQYYQAIGQYLENPDDIKSLDLSGLSLKQLPEEVRKFKNLEYLNLSNNRFKTIPDIVYNIGSLKTIDLSHNRIKRVAFVKNHNIERVILHHNKIEEIEYYPYYPSTLSALRMIDLSHNQLKETPNFDTNSAIDTILLSHNQLNSFYNLHMSLPRKIGYLDVSSNEIEGINEDLFEFIGFDYNELITLANKCESLNLSNNFFEYFPYEIFKTETLSKLIMQNCIYNAFDDKLPTKLFADHLKYLDLSNTEDKLDNLSINDLTYLETLLLENTRFEDFSIRLPNLTYLNLNNLTANRSFEIKCPQLQYLKIDYNYISSLSDEDLEQMSYLKTIVITNYQEDKSLISYLKNTHPKAQVILDRLSHRKH